MKKEREVDKDTVVAYHSRVQGQIKNELNGVDLGPGSFPCFLAKVFFALSLILGIVGVLVITLRHRHVYLISWNDQFLGPAFIIIFILLLGAAAYMVVIALRRSNEYRRGLVVSITFSALIHCLSSQVLTFSKNYSWSFCCIICNSFYVPSC